MTNIINTGVSLPPQIRDLLRRVSRARQQVYGGKASVSALVLECIRAREDDLRAEVEAAWQVEKAGVSE